MKKTLCKAIHEANQEVFIQIEDIQRICIENELTVTIVCKNTLNQFFKIIMDSKEEAEDLLYKICIELEEYYEKDNL